MTFSNTDPYSGFTQFTSTLSGNPYLLTGNPYVLSLGLSPLEIKRINDEIKYWRFYKGEHWTYKRPDGEPQNTINYARRFIDKSVAFLVGKGFTINPGKEAESITKTILDDVWDDNHRQLLATDIAQSAGITGQAWVKVAVEVYDPETQPFEYEMYPNGRIKLLLLPGYTVFPRYDGHDRHKLIGCFIIYPIWIIENGIQKAIWYREVITPDYIQEYMNDELVNERPNILREIPIVQIRNFPVAGESYGYPDMKDIMPLQQEFNEKTTDVSDIINYHAAPITVIYGAKGSNLEKGAKKIWGGLPKDAKVENLELKSDLKAAMDYIQLIKTAMFEIMSMPEDALGADQTAISNTTGIALHMKNQSLIDVMRVKQKTLTDGILHINRLILRYAVLMEDERLNLDAFNALTPKQKYIQEIDFPDPLPKDELIEMQLIAQKLSTNLMTHPMALEELGDPNPEETWLNIKAEMLELADLGYMASVAQNGGVDPVAQQQAQNVDPNNPNPQTSTELMNPKNRLGLGELMKRMADNGLNTNIGGIVHASEKANPINIPNYNKDGGPS